MRARSYDCGYGCPIEAALDVIGGRWKGIILYHLLDRQQRFGELRRLLPKITQRMLTLQLRELERDGLVHREVYPETPLRVEYSLTSFGSGLRPLLLQLREVGVEHMARQRAATETIADAPPGEPTIVSPSSGRAAAR